MAFAYNSSTTAAQCTVSTIIAILFRVSRCFPVAGVRSLISYVYCTCRYKYVNVCISFLCCETCHNFSDMHNISDEVSQRYPMYYIKAIKIHSSIIDK